MSIETVGILAAFAIALVYLVYWFFTKHFNYWKNKNVPFLEPAVFFGSTKSELLNRKSWVSFVNKCYLSFKNHGFGGVYFVRKPTFWLCDPKLIETCLVEDFVHFHDRWNDGMGEESVEESTLLFSKGEKWRSLRLKLSPAFASGKVKGMFQQILASTEHYIEKMLKHSVAYDGADVEALTTDFVTEVLVSFLCGVQMSNSKEAVEVNEALRILYTPSLCHSIVLILTAIVPLRLLKKIGIKGGPQQAIETLSKVIKSILIFRKQSGIRRDDVLQTMLDLKSEEEKDNNLKKGLSANRSINSSKNHFPCSKLPKIFYTEEMIAAQILNFLSGGTKPTAVTITFALFEIAKSPQTQNKLRKEIHSAVLKNKGWNVDALKEMTYLDQVIQETLRMYNFNSLLTRTVADEYKIPGTEVTLEKDMQVFIPSIGLHMDPDFYFCPKEFRPERWEGNNYKMSSTYLPFGHGPRMCISVRLAVLTMKLCLARVLNDHRVSISQKMRVPLKFDEVCHFKVKGGVCLKLNKIEKPDEK